MKRIYVDMDGVMCDIYSAYQWARDTHPEVEFPQSIPSIFENLAPIYGAIEAVNQLREDYDVWILSAPSTRNPNCYTEKRIWIGKYFDYQFTKRLILCTNKSLLKGDYLIDDHVEGKGQNLFEGQLVHFGSVKFPNWESVLGFLKHG